MADLYIDPHIEVRRRRAVCKCSYLADLENRGSPVLCKEVGGGERGREEKGREGEARGEGGKQRGREGEMDETSCKCFYLADLEEGVLSDSASLSEVVVCWECPVDVTEYHLLARRLLPASEQFYFQLYCWNKR